MKYLVDTHVFLWWTSESSRLSSQAMEILSDTTNIIYISVVNVWEIQIKSQLGKLTLPASLEIIVSKQIDEQGFHLLQIELNHIYGLSTLPDHHRDPFDRLLIAQARHEQLSIVTADQMINAYDVGVIW